MPAFLLIQNRYVQPWLVRLLPSSLWFCFPNLNNSTTTDFIAHERLRSAEQQHNRLELFINEEDFPHQNLNKLIKFIQSTFYEVLPAVLIQGRWVWMCALTCILFASAFVCATQMRLPQYNPLQLFHSKKIVFRFIQF